MLGRAQPNPIERQPTTPTDEEHRLPGTADDLTESLPTFSLRTGSSVYLVETLPILQEQTAMSPNGLPRSSPEPQPLLGDRLCSDTDGSEDFFGQSRVELAVVL